MISFFCKISLLAGILFPLKEVTLQHQIFSHALKHVDYTSCGCLFWQRTEFPLFLWIQYNPPHLCLHLGEKKNPQMVKNHILKPPWTDWLATKIDFSCRYRQLSKRKRAKISFFFHVCTYLSARAIHLNRTIEQQ